MAGYTCASNLLSAILSKQGTLGGIEKSSTTRMNKLKEAFSSNDRRSSVKKKKKF